MLLSFHLLSLAGLTQSVFSGLPGLSTTILNSPTVVTQLVSVFVLLWGRPWPSLKCVFKQSLGSYVDKIQVECDQFSGIHYCVFEPKRENSGYLHFYAEFSLETVSQAIICAIDSSCFILVFKAHRRSEKNDSWIKGIFLATIFWPWGLTSTSKGKHTYFNNAL